MSEKTDLRILLVEDDQEDADIFRRNAAESEQYRIEVNHVTTSDEALQRLSEGRYGLIFLDQRLGEAVTGLDILKRIRTAGSEPPVIVLTGTGDEELAVEMMKAGAMDYLLKDTFNAEILQRSARYALKESSLAAERRRAEEALRESEERYRAVFEQAVDAILLVDAETGAFVDFNESAHENLGYTREEFEKLRIPDVEAIESAEKVTKHLRKIVTEGDDTFETKHRTKDGEIRDVLVSTRAISIHGKSFVLSIWRDITERRRLEAAAREADRLRAIRDLAAGMAHNFNNLLTGVLGYAQLVRVAMKEQGSPLEDIDKLIGCTERTAKFAQELRMAANPREAPASPVALEVLVRRLEEDCQDCLPDGIDLVINVRTPHTEVQAALERVLLALRHICENATEAMPDGGTLSIVADTVLRQGEQGEAAFAMIAITDTGKGMSDEMRERVFEPFWSTKGTVAVGLSLAITRTIIDAHNGVVEVESSPGQGATFRVFLPAVSEVVGSSQYS